MPVEISRVAGAIDRGIQRRNEAAPLRGVGLNDVFGRTVCPIAVPPSGLRVEPKDAQLLGAATGLRDARGPRDGLIDFFAMSTGWPPAPSC
jgi:hypothetical protein